MNMTSTVRDEKLLDRFSEHVQAAALALEYVERFERNGWWSSDVQLSHAIAELQAAQAMYADTKAAHDRMYDR